jgi:NADP-dependent 3-hydroxy acid dehydrogenase YdfG
MFLARSFGMSRTLRGNVVVITGASSGIGRAAARLFAGKGARLVLAARRADELERVAAACRAAGARAIAVPTDVTDAAAVEALAARALAEFGAIDVWCNNAGVYAMGELGDVPLDVHRRVVEVNLLGVVNGMRAALAQMRLQGHGTIINTTSLAGKSPYAYAAIYCATKAAVRALTQAVRQEQDNEQLQVCAVSTRRCFSTAPTTPAASSSRPSPSTPSTGRRAPSFAVPSGPSAKSPSASCRRCSARCAC